MRLAHTMLELTSRRPQLLVRLVAADADADAVCIRSKSLRSRPQMRPLVAEFAFDEDETKRSSFEIRAM